MVAKFTQPDYNTQTGTAYPLNIDASMSVLARRGAAFAPRAQDTPDMTVRVDAGSVYLANAIFEVAAQSTGTITAPVTNPRIDRVVMDDLGNVFTITGTEAASPVAPALINGRIPIARVLLQTSSAQITNSMITDERPGVFHSFRLPRSYIAGLSYANNATDPTNDIDIAVGMALSSSGEKTIILATAFDAPLVKRLDAAWAAGSGNGGLDTGVVGNNNYYIHLIMNDATGAVDVLFSLSATAPTMPSGYDRRRLIGWFKRLAGAIVAFKTYEAAGGGIEFNWSAPPLDVDRSSPAITTTRRTDALSVPLDFSVVANIDVGIIDATAGTQVRIMSPDETDAPVTATNLNINPQISGMVIASVMSVRTSATGTIAARAAADIDNYRVRTTGFQWSRR
jgi:hypothetical protein